MTAEEYPAVLGLLIRGLATQSGFADNAREILRHVGHPHPEVRAAVAFAFEGSTDHEDHEDHKDREALQDVLTLARDPYAEVRRHAVAHLSGLIGRPPAVHAAVHTALRRALYDPDPDVRRP
ncbi:HEAT repeat domain-containing protein [Streptomyces sp. NBC_00487]|uniref:HEAT repeat domain-containing protein n=1 Tax=unclassified Streptomyces TaxID=2593676 RepID=UPI002E183EA5|nr:MULTISPECIES: HEAT repeat domain-containing protein [unclassified Streptomyces]